MKTLDAVISENEFAKLAEYSMWPPKDVGHTTTIGFLFLKAPDLALARDA
jgi:hypothetical protein